MCAEIVSKNSFPNLTGFGVLDGFRRKRHVLSPVLCWKLEYWRVCMFLLL